MSISLSGRVVRRLYKTARWVLDHTWDGRRPDPVAFDGRVPAPEWGGVETTRFCNLSCRMCLPFNAGITTAGPHMPIEQFRRYAAQVFPFVDVFQPSVAGEPLMSKGFDEMLDVAAQWGVGVDINTNATLLSERMARKLVPLLRDLIVSFDGVRPETFEKIRVGAKFDEVLTNVRGAVAIARELPEESRPVMGFNCTLMRDNAPELADLVDLAADLGLDFLTVSHVVPGDEDTARQSLAYDVELARRSIDAAVARARKRRICFHVTSLGTLIADRAGASESDEGRILLEAVDYDWKLRRQKRRARWRPVRSPEVEARREEARRKGEIDAATPTPVFPKRQPSIHVCDFLWKRSYVHIDGEIKPCCVDGIHVTGNLDQEPFDQLWNNENHRQLRQRLVRKDPDPKCRGCHFIREIKDPRQIGEWLQGRRVPAADEVVATEIVPPAPVENPTRPLPPRPRLQA